MAEAMVPAPGHRRLVPFWDKQFKELLKKKNKARARGDLSMYKRLRRSFRSCFRAKHRRWQAQLGENITPSNAWSTVHLLHGRQSKKKTKTSPAPGESSDFRRAAELTAKFAAISNDRLIFRSPTDELHNIPLPPGPSIPIDALGEFLTEEVLQRAIFKPMVGSSAGHDCIPAGILRAVWGSLNGRLFLRLIISASLSLGHVPPVWKRAIIHPIPKAQSPEFRPISLLNQVGKVCDRIVTWFL
jgi:hypothetical protein